MRRGGSSVGALELRLGRLQEIALRRVEQVATGGNEVVHCDVSRSSRATSTGASTAVSASSPELLTVDHVQPRMRGGDRSGGNLVTACGGCNARKGLAAARRVPPRRRRGARALFPPRRAACVAEDSARGGGGDGDVVSAVDGSVTVTAGLGTPGVPRSADQP